MKNQDSKISKVLKAFAQRPIAYQKIYAQLAESVTAGLLLSQIVYWWYTGAGESEFYKTDSAFADELAMGARELRNAKAKLKKLGIISTIRKGVPCRTFYKLEESALLAQISSWAEKAKLVGPKKPNLIGRKSQTITDNTTKTTTDKDKDFSSGDLSKANAQDRGYHLLISQGVNQKVARSIVYEQHTPLQSIEETIKNGLAKQKAERNFTLESGYIVAALNGARKEGKTVTSTKASRAFKREIENQQKPRIHPTKEEVAERKQKLLEQSKRLMAAS